MISSSSSYRDGGKGALLDYHLRMTVGMDDGDGMKYLLTDHLGSVVAVTNANGGLVSHRIFNRNKIAELWQLKTAFYSQRKTGWIWSSFFIPFILFMLATIFSNFTREVLWFDVIVNGVYLLAIGTLLAAIHRVESRANARRIGASA